MKTQATLITQAQTETNDGVIKGVANSLTRTRSGITVTQEAGKKVIGKKVPLLLSHDWSSMPIGEATMTSVDDDGLAYSGSIFESVSNRQQILDGINAGVLSVSIGFGVGEIDENNNIDDIDLLELSVTPVPADPKATITQSLEIIKQENVKMADQEPAPTDDKQPTMQDVLDAIADVKKDLEEFIKSQEPKDNQDTPDDSQPDKATESVDELVTFVKKLNVSDNMQALRLGKILKKFDKQ
jgi:HK97 family phage prohead protease